MNAPKPNSISKLIPASAAELCPHCQQWESGSEDSYCGFCGRLLAKLSVSKVGPLILGMATQRILVFTNSGSRSLKIKIVPDGRRFSAVAFEPLEFQIAEGKKAGVQARLDERVLPDNFVARRAKFRCQIDGDSRKTFAFFVDVKAGPKPVVTPTRLNFGGLEEGVTKKRQIEIANRGGVPLNIKEVTPEGSSQLRVSGAASLPLKVMPSAQQTIEVAWDTTAEETLEETAGAGFRVVFGNYPTPSFLAAEANVFRRLLKITPDSVRLETLLSKHRRIQRMKLSNLGTVELEISKIETDSSWIEIVSEQPSFVLAPKASQQLELVLHPQDLESGPHRGEVRVYTPDQEEPRVVEVSVDVLHPQRYDDYIGIDFGTTNSVVALWNPTGKQQIELVKPGGGKSALIPSLLVFLSGETSYLTGFDAAPEAGHRSENAVRSIKRVMGVRKEHKFFGNRFSPEALATLIIQDLIEQAELRLLELTGTYHDVQKAIVTVPANFFDLQIRGILEACEAAGIDTEAEQARAAYQKVKEAIGKAVNPGIIIDEPSAAALFYLGHLENEEKSGPELYRRIESAEGLRALIFDHGGGTLDVSLAHVRKLPKGQIGITVLANRGDNRVGGESLDLALMRRLLTKCRHEIETFDNSLISMKYNELEARRLRDGWNIDTWERVLRARNVWKDAAEGVKIQLSSKTHAKFEIPAYAILCREQANSLVAAEQAYTTPVKQKDLLEVSKSVLDRCEKVVYEALEIAQIVPGDVDYVFHTGRQSLMPAIRDRVKAVFPNLDSAHDILDRNHVKVCVAKGAALYGMIKRGMGEAGVVFLDEGKKLPHSYGVEKIVGIAQRHFEEVLTKGTVYPARAEKTYPPEVIPPDGWLNLKIYENLGSKTGIVGNPDIRQIGQISFDTMADEIPGADLTFAIDANRQLQVVADEKEVPIEPESWEDEEGWTW